jgi:tetratricopeptide (TPR) repeat protein
MKRRHKRAPATTVPNIRSAAKPIRTSVLPLSRKRLWVFRVVAFVLPTLLLFLLSEAGLRLCGYGYPVGFLLPAQSNGQDTFVQNDRFGWRFFGPDMARQPWPLSLAAAKPRDTVRVFVFGESAAYGDPQPEFGLPRFLEALLGQRYPGTRFEVVNAAMTAINSHAILAIARDCAARQGDIWVVYMGNNEVVGPYGAGTVFGHKGAGLELVRCSLTLRATRTGQCFEGLLASLHRRSPEQKEWGGMQMFLSQQVRQGAALMPVVYANVQRNLADILEAGHRGGAKIVLSTVAGNLKDCAPFGSLHAPDLTATDLARWEQRYQEGVQAQQAGLSAVALDCFAQAGRLDGAFAELHFRWGQCCLALGQRAEAWQHFIRARDEDTLRFRCDTRLNDIIRQAATGREQEGILLADAQATLAQSSPDGIPGHEFFYDHVHLTFEGNYLLALTLAQQAAKLLPESVARQAPAERPWASLEDCARRLAWTDRDRFEADSRMLGRLNDPPFTTQFNHAEQTQRLRAELERLLPATRPEALRSAVSLCREALAATHHDWVLNQQLAHLLLKLRDLDGTAAALRKVVNLLPRNADAWQELGGVLAEQKQDAEALGAFQQARRLALDPTAACTGLAQVLAGQGKNEEALQQFEEALKHKPYYGPAHLGAGKALEALGRPEEAGPHYHKALQDRMMTPSALAALGQFAFEKGWFAAAATNFTDALRLNPADPATHVNLGVALAQLGRRADARDHYAEAVRLDPNLAEARARLGIELGREGNDAGASDQFAAAVRLKPDLLEARLNLGIALAKQQRKSEALEQFQEVLRRSPTNTVALRYLHSFTSGKKTEPAR